MADRLFNGKVSTLQNGIVQLYGSITIGSSGAIDSSSTKGWSVAKTAAETGRYTVTLEDSYVGFVNCQCVMEIAADAAPSTGGHLFAIRNVSVADSTPTFDIQVLDAAGADTNPTSGFKIWVTIVLRNSESF